MNVHDLLKESRKKLQSGWCQGALAQDESGKPIEPTSHLATSWSVVGALYATNLQTMPWDFIYDDVPFQGVCALAEIIKRRYLDEPYQGHMSALLSSWNDSTSLMEIFMVLDEAIKGTETCSRKPLALSLPY